MSKFKEYLEAVLNEAKSTIPCAYCGSDDTWESVREGKLYNVCNNCGEEERIKRYASKDSKEPIEQDKDIE